MLQANLPKMARSGTKRLSALSSTYRKCDSSIREPKKVCAVKVDNVRHSESLDLKYRWKNITTVCNATTSVDTTFATRTVKTDEIPLIRRILIAKVPMPNVPILVIVERMSGRKTTAKTIEPAVTRIRTILTRTNCRRSTIFKLLQRPNVVKPVVPTVTSVLKII